jgi:multisubunit Na+/H+ antiporter MnhF subunit
MNNGKLILKYIIEAFVGIIVLVVSLDVLSFPLRIIKGKNMAEQIFAILIISVAVVFSITATYKAVKYVHKNLKLDDNSEQGNQGDWR